MSKILKLNSYSRYDELGNRDYMVYEVEYTDGHKEYVSREMFRNLKAFEIVREKQVNVYNFVWYHEHHKWMNYEEYCKILDLPEEEGCDDTHELREFCKCGERLTQKEYELLSEVLL